MTKRKVEVAGPFKIDGDVCFLVSLTRGQWTIVDESTLPLMLKYLWFCQWNRSTGSYYVVRKERIDGRRITVRLNRELLQLPAGRELVGDHKNRVTLDNRLRNLRACTQSRNCANRRLHSNNRSGYKGVSFCTRQQEWQAQICVIGKSVHLGFFNDPGAAHHAYCRAAEANFKDFARVA